MATYDCPADEDDDEIESREAESDADAEEVDPEGLADMIAADNSELSWFKQARKFVDDRLHRLPVDTGGTVDEPQQSAPVREAEDRALVAAFDAMTAMLGRFKERPTFGLDVTKAGRDG